MLQADLFYIRRGPLGGVTGRSVWLGECTNIRLTSFKSTHWEPGFSTWWLARFNFSGGLQSLWSCAPGNGWGIFHWKKLGPGIILEEGLSSMFIQSSCIYFMNISHVPGTVLGVWGPQMSRIGVWPEDTEVHNDSILISAIIEVWIQCYGCAMENIQSTWG